MKIDEMDDYLIDKIVYKIAKRLNDSGSRINEMNEELINKIAYKTANRIFALTTIIYIGYYVINFFK